MLEAKDMDLYAVLFQENGPAIYIKAWSFFVSQGGLVDDWGKRWKMVFASSIQDAREQAKENCFPIQREMWINHYKHLNLKYELEPWNRLKV